MAREDNTEVLVVGAGPSGLLAALMLAERGVQVRLFDKEARTTTHSYACMLHPASVRCLKQLGLAEEVQALGQRVDTVAFYEGNSRCAEVKLSRLQGDSAYAIVLPQNRFEEVLEQRLARKHHVPVLWNHRLADFSFEGDAVIAIFEKLTQSAKGYIVADWDWAVQRTYAVRASWLVGADGHASMVRSRLGIACEELGSPELFAVFEFESDPDHANEVRIAMDASTTNVLWPLPDHRCRWSFQLVNTKSAGSFPEKDRQPAHHVREQVDQRTRQRVELLAHKRAPWFHGNIKDFDWWAHIRFEHRLAQEFGKDRAWLVGDAAHQTGPAGVQSMNAGLSEAADLAVRLSNILRSGAPRSTLDEYGRVHREQFLRLLGLRTAPKPGNQTSPWVQDHAARLLQCLPATGDELQLLVQQLGLVC